MTDIEKLEAILKELASVAVNLDLPDSDRHIAIEKIHILREAIRRIKLL